MSSVDASQIDVRKKDTFVLLPDYFAAFRAGFFSRLAVLNARVARPVQREVSRQ